MKRFVVIVALLVAQSLSAQEADLQFEQANKFYREGDYAQAAAGYEQIIKNGYEQSSLYYNLGNAYFKLKNIPAAILNYERAKRLAPHDDDILYNLRLANIRVVDKVEPVPELFFVDWWHSLANAFSSSVWAGVAIAALWFASVIGILFRFITSPLVQRLSFLLSLLFLFVSVMGFVLSIQQYRHEHYDRAAIIFSQSVAVKSSPDPQSTDLFVLHEGVKVTLLDSVGEWEKIRLADGKLGWLQTTDLQAI